MTGIPLPFGLGRSRCRFLRVEPILCTAPIHRKQRKCGMLQIEKEVTVLFVRTEVVPLDAIRAESSQQRSRSNRQTARSQPGDPHRMKSTGHLTASSISEATAAWCWDEPHGKFEEQRKHLNDWPPTEPCDGPCSALGPRVSHNDSHGFVVHPAARQFSHLNHPGLGTASEIDLLHLGG